MEWEEAKARLEAIAAALVSETYATRLVDDPGLSADIRAALQRVEELEREKAESLIPAYEQEVKERRAAEAEVRRLEGLIAWPRERQLHEWEYLAEALRIREREGRR